MVETTYTKFGKDWGFLERLFRIDWLPLCCSSLQEKEAQCLSIWILCMMYVSVYNEGLMGYLTLEGILVMRKHPWYAI